MKKLLMHSKKFMEVVIVATMLKSLKGRRTLTPTDIVAAMIYYAVEDKGEKTFTSDHEKIHKFVYEIVEKIPELKKGKYKDYFIFTNWYPFKYSYEVEDAITNLRIGRVITVPDNPYYTQYELEESGKKFIEERILPLLPKNLQDKIRERAKEVANTLFEYEA